MPVTTVTQMKQKTLKIPFVSMFSYFGESACII